MGIIDGDMDMDDLKYELEEEARTGTRIKVIGVGGGGCNAVARMVEEGLDGVEFYAMNTDVQALSACQVPNKLQLGAKITKGLGAGSNPEIGRQAALENTDRIVELLQGADMVFVTAGLGGGTGTGAAPVIASLAKELDALTVAVVTKPFGFEGLRRMRMAEDGLGRLAGTVDTVIAIPNDRLLKLVPKGTSFFESFKVADDLLRQAVQGISDIIITPGLINRDFSDIKATMIGMGYAMMGTATGQRRKCRRRSRAPGHQLPPAGRQPHRRFARHPDQHHRLEQPRTARSQRSLHHHSRCRGLRRRADQLRRDLQRVARRHGQDHGHRHRLPARKRADPGAPRVGHPGDQGAAASAGSRTGARSCVRRGAARAGTRSSSTRRRTRPRPRYGRSRHPCVFAAGHATELKQTKPLQAERWLAWTRIANRSADYQPAPLGDLVRVR